MTTEDNENNGNNELERLLVIAKDLGIKPLHIYKNPVTLQKKIDDKMAEKSTQSSDQVVSTTEKQDEVPKIESDVLSFEEIAIVQKLKRKKAPQVVVNAPHVDARTLKITELERIDPSSKYMTQGSKVTDHELKAKGQERTGLTLGNDIIVRKDKKAFYEGLNARNALKHDEISRAIDDKDRIVQAHDASPRKVKAPRD